MSLFNTHKLIAYAVLSIRCIDCALALAGVTDSVSCAVNSSLADVYNSKVQMSMVHLCNGLKDAVRRSGNDDV